MDHWQVKDCGLFAHAVSSTCDFYVSDMLKYKVYVNNLHSLQKLKENIQHEVSIVPR